MQPLKAKVHNGRLVLDEPTDLPEGEVVDLVPVDEVLAHGGDYLDDDERQRLHDSLRRSIEQMKAGQLIEADAAMPEDELRLDELDEPGDRRVSGSQAAELPERTALGVWRRSRRYFAIFITVPAPWSVQYTATGSWVINTGSDCPDAISSTVPPVRFTRRMAPDSLLVQ